MEQITGSAPYEYCFIMLQAMIQYYDHAFFMMALSELAIRYKR